MSVAAHPPVDRAVRRGLPQGPTQTEVWTEPRRSGAWRITALVTLVYAAYAVFLTWPLATDPGGLLSGSLPNADLGGSVASIAYVVAHHVFPFAPATFHALNAPYGQAQPWVDNIASFPGTALLVGLGYVFGAVASSAVFLWLSFVLSGTSMFLLTRRLFRSVPAAALAGFVFAFYPFAVDKINGHYQYMDGWIIVLAVWRMLELVDRPTRRNALLAGCATALAMWFTFYFILIAGLAFAALAMLACLVWAVRGERKAGLRTVLLSAVPIILLLVGLGALSILAGGASSGGVRTQPIQDLYAFSARPLEWLLPDRHNLIFGGLTRGYLSSHLHGSNFGESSLYLGLSVIGLALLGLAIAVRRLHATGRDGLHDRALVAALAGGVLALVAALFSLPPSLNVLGVKVAMPSGLVYMLTSTFRVYSRFVELLELGLCILLAFAVSRLLARLRPRAGAVLVAALAVVLVVDLWARPPVRTSATTPPAEYVWLRDHPGGIVADYPIMPADFPDYHALFWQTYDGHPVIQGYALGSESEAIKLGLADLREPGTASRLAALGVKYIVVHPGQPGANQATIRRGHYIVRFTSPSGGVWQVGAAPARTEVSPLQNFSWVQGSPGAEYRWMTDTGVLGLQARSCATSCRGTLTFTSGSHQIPRTLTVTDQATGRVLARRRIPAWIATQVIVPGIPLSHGQARLVLSTDVAATVFEPGIDSRLLSIYVREPALTLGAGGP